MGKLEERVFWVLACIIWLCGLFLLLQASAFFYRHELFPLTVMKKDTLQHLLQIGVRNMG